MEYLTLWPKFFFDILSLVGLNPLGVDVYLRTLMAIDAEVVDRNILHSPEVRRRRKCQEVQVQTLLLDLESGSGGLGPGIDAELDPSLDACLGPGSRCWCQVQVSEVLVQTMVLDQVQGTGPGLDACQGPGSESRSKSRHRFSSVRWCSFRHWHK